MRSMHQPPGSSAWTEEDERRQEAARKAARRHTRLVKVLRFVLPASGILIAAGVVGMVILQNILSGIGIGDIRLSADGLVMENPHLSGKDGDRSYSVSADQAIQRITDPRIIDLDNIRAEVALSAQDKANITAATGTYDTGAETLMLRGGIKVDYSKGYTAEFDYLDIDMKSGKIKTSDAVAVQADGGSIDAGSMDFNQTDGILTFSEGVKMTLHPAALENNQ
ncbi:LPS export ABC transporter periplasmic protein LptC [Rhodobacteraceae bacterium RKSG542]|nr:LPS export ABC transporter periplasmic protein LptC [Pseudovibrio flavus]